MPLPGAIILGFGTKLFSITQPPIDYDTLIYNLNPIFWFRADGTNAVSTGGESVYTTEIYNKVGTDHVATTSDLDTISQPAQKIAFNNAMTITSYQGSSAIFRSNLSSDYFDFLHNGSAFEIVNIIDPDRERSNAYYLMGEWSGGTSRGMYMGLQNDNVTGFLQSFTRVSSGPYPLSQWSVALNDAGPTCLNFSHDGSGGYSIWQDNAAKGTNTRPTGSRYYSGGKLTILGSQNSSYHYTGTWSDTIIFNRALTTIERTAVWNYCQSRYEM